MALSDRRRALTRLARVAAVGSLALAGIACSDGSGEDRGTATSSSDSGTRASAGPATDPGTVPPTSRPTREAPPAPTSPEDITRTIAFGGDLLIHETVTSSAARAGEAVGQPYDFSALLSPLSPVLEEADLALCHLEVPLTGPPLAGFPLFRAPIELAQGIRDAGYDGCSTASNHSLDAGRDGIASTLGAMDAAGLGHVGMARTPEEDVAPRIYRLDGVGIGHLSYSFGFNGIPLPADAPWAADLIDLDTIARDATATRAAGADVVVVSMHWGTEYQHEPDTFQTDTAVALAGIDDVDLVVGHHAHVVQPIEQVGDTWVVYGLGNQLSGQRTVTRRDGLTVVVTVGGAPGERMTVRAVAAVPTWVDLVPGQYRVIPVAETLARDDLDPTWREGLELSLYRTMDVVRSRGADIPTRAT